MLLGFLLLLLPLSQAGPVEGNVSRPIEQPINYDVLVPGPELRFPSRARAKQLFDQMTRPWEGMESPFAKPWETVYSQGTQGKNALGLQRNRTGDPSTRPYIVPPRPIPPVEIEQTYLWNPRDPFRRRPRRLSDNEERALFEKLPYHPLRVFNHYSDPDENPAVLPVPGYWPHPVQHSVDRDPLTDVNANPLKPWRDFPTRKLDNPRLFATSEPQFNDSSKLPVYQTLTWQSRFPKKPMPDLSKLPFGMGPSAGITYDERGLPKLVLPGTIEPVAPNPGETPAMAKASPVNTAALPIPLPLNLPSIAKAIPIPALGALGGLFGGPRFSDLTPRFPASPAFSSFLELESEPKPSEQQRDAPPGRDWAPYLQYATTPYNYLRPSPLARPMWNPSHLYAHPPPQGHYPSWNPAHTQHSAPDRYPISPNRKPSASAFSDSYGSQTNQLPRNPGAFPATVAGASNLGSPSNLAHFSRYTGKKLRIVEPIQAYPFKPTEVEVSRERYDPTRDIAKQPPLPLQTSDPTALMEDPRLPYIYTEGKPAVTDYKVQAGPRADSANEQPPGPVPFFWGHPRTLHPIPGPGYKMSSPEVDYQRIKGGPMRKSDYEHYYAMLERESVQRKVGRLKTEGRLDDAQRLQDLQPGREEQFMQEMAQMDAQAIAQQQATEGPAPVTVETPPPPPPVRTEDVPVAPVLPSDPNLPANPEHEAPREIAAVTTGTTETTEPTTTVNEETQPQTTAPVETNNANPPPVVENNPTPTPVVAESNPNPVVSESNPNPVVSESNPNSNLETPVLSVPENVADLGSGEVLPVDTSVDESGNVETLTNMEPSPEENPNMEGENGGGGGEGGEGEGGFSQGGINAVFAEKSSHSKSRFGTARFRKAMRRARQAQSAMMMLEVASVNNGKTQNDNDWGKHGNPEDPLGQHKPLAPHLKSKIKAKASPARGRVPKVPPHSKGKVPSGHKPPTVVLPLEPEKPAKAPISVDEKLLEHAASISRSYIGDVNRAVRNAGLDPSKLGAKDATSYAELTKQQQHEKHYPTYHHVLRAPENDALLEPLPHLPPLDPLDSISEDHAGDFGKLDHLDPALHEGAKELADFLAKRTDKLFQARTEVRAKIVQNLDAALTETRSSGKKAEQAENTPEPAASTFVETTAKSQTQTQAGAELSTVDSYKAVEAQGKVKLAWWDHPEAVKRNQEVDAKDPVAQATSHLAANGGTLENFKGKDALTAEQKPDNLVAPGILTETSAQATVETHQKTFPDLGSLGGGRGGGGGSNPLGGLGSSLGGSNPQQQPQQQQQGSQSQSQLSSDLPGYGVPVRTPATSNTDSLGRPLNLPGASVPGGSPPSESQASPHNGAPYDTFVDRMYQYQYQQRVTNPAAPQSLLYPPLPSMQQQASLDDFQMRGQGPRQFNTPQQRSQASNPYSNPMTSAYYNKLAYPYNYPFPPYDGNAAAQQAGVPGQVNPPLKPQANDPLSSYYFPRTYYPIPSKTGPGSFAVGPSVTPFARPYVAPWAMQGWNRPVGNMNPNFPTGPDSGQYGARNQQQPAPQPQAQQPQRPVSQLPSSVGGDIVQQALRGVVPSLTSPVQVVINLAPQSQPQQPQPQRRSLVEESASATPASSEHESHPSAPSQESNNNAAPPAPAAEERRPDFFF